MPSCRKYAEVLIIVPNVPIVPNVHIVPSVLNVPLFPVSSRVRH